MNIRLWQFLSVFVASICCAGARPALMFSWEPVTNCDCVVTTYRIHWGVESCGYTNYLDVGNVTSATFSEDLVPGGHYYFSLTAVDDGGIDGDYSEELDFWMPGGTNSIPTLSPVIDYTVRSGMTSDPIEITIADSETSAEELYVGAGSAQYEMLPYTSFSWSGSGTKRTLRITPVGERSGKATVVVWVNDRNNNSSSRTFTVTVLGLRPGSPSSFRFRVP
jgi:hypothetical protein